uniref:Receptor for retinol uptake STRA6 n=1 Tax=Sphenodon punctatus TaxID=8508 RepID=A0A8D0L566_SPHPU
MLGLSLLVKRKNLYQSCWHGAPGLLRYPEEPLPCFSLPAPPLSLSPCLEYWKIMALLYYPAFYYPLIACATVRHRAGYLLGCLLSWCHCVVHIWQKADCPQSPKIYRYYSLLSYLPVIFCLMVLSLWYPALLVRSFTEWEVGAWGPKSLSLGLDEREDEGREFLGFPLVTSHPSACNPEARMIDWLTSDFGIAGFQVPLKLVLSVTMAVIAVYQVALLLLVAFIPNIQIIRAGMTKEITVLLVQFGLIPSENAGGIPGDMEKELATVKHYLWALEVCYVCSLVISCLLTFCMLMRSLVMHRMNLQSLYRGAVLDVFYHPHELRPSQQSLVCWMSFASFQTAFTCLGLLIQQIIFFICTVGFTFLVAIPLRSELLAPSGWEWAWNDSAVSFTLSPPYRRALYILTYLLFPINVLVGVLAGVWRMVISALYNAIHFCQLDISLLNRSVELFDPGYRTYCHYLKIEVSQSHPVMKAFCFLLLQLPSPEGQTVLKPTDVEEGIQLMQTKKVSPKVSKSKQSRARWCLAYTLLNNPSLLPLRKTVLADPTANGTQNSPAKP